MFKIKDFVTVNYFLTGLIGFFFICPKMIFFLMSKIVVVEIKKENYIQVKKIEFVCFI